MKLKQKAIADLSHDMQASRRDKSWTYAELAMKSHVEISQVQKICNGQFRILTANVMQICAALDVPVAAVGYEEGRLAAEVIALWDKTSVDADRLVQLLRALRDVRQRG